MMSGRSALSQGSQAPFAPAAELLHERPEGRTALMAHNIDDFIPLPGDLLRECQDSYDRFAREEAR